MGNTVRIGSYQGPIVENGFDQNARKVRAVLEQSQGLHLDFLCFPEAYLTGYSQEAIQHGAVSLDDPRLLEWMHGIREFEPVVLVGMCERRGEQVFNTQLVIENGQLLGVYHKSILTDYDAQYFSTDLNLPIFEARGVRFGVVICHDTSFVEPALLLRWKGARLLFTPHYNDIPLAGLDTPAGKVSFWEHRTMVLNNQAALATLLKMVVVRSNVIIVHPDHLGAGDSNIWNMDGVLVAAGEPFTECVVTAEFDKLIFQQEHWIDRHQVPPKLLEMIWHAAQEYP